MIESAVPKESAADRWGSIVLGAAVLVVVTGVITFFLSGAVFGYSPGGSTTPSTPTGSGGTTPISYNGSVHLYQTISFNPYSGHDQYYPANFTIPAGLPIMFTIASYDNGTNYPPLGASDVIGTVNGTETIQGGGPGTPQGAVSYVPPNDTAHTFTIDQGGVHLNVVVPPTANTSYPVRIFFTVIFATPGTYTWACQAPCDPYSMTTPGYMTGTVTVT